MGRCWVPCGFVRLCTQARLSALKIRGEVSSTAASFGHEFSVRGGARIEIMGYM